MIGPILIGAGLLYLATRKDTVKDQGDGFIPLPHRGGGAQVYDRANARGVHPALQQLLDDWQAEGWFDVRVASGVRTASQQAANVAAGLTNATDITTTPHGRGGALDIHPIGFNQNACFNVQPDMLTRMNEFGAWAKTKGFVWGGDWQKFYSPACQNIDGVRGDRPHVEMANWVTLPYPPPAYFSPV